jgi:hypothetical protein
MTVAHATKTLLCCCVLVCMSTQQVFSDVRTLRMINRSGKAMTLITAVEKIRPNALLTFDIPGGLGANETDIGTINLPTGTCLFDVTYQPSVGTKIIQQNVDLCSVESVVVE